MSVSYNLIRLSFVDLRRDSLGILIATSIRAWEHRVGFGRLRLLLNRWTILRIMSALLVSAGLKGRAGGFGFARMAMIMRPMLGRQFRRES